MYGIDGLCDVEYFINSRLFCYIIAFTNRMYYHFTIFMLICIKDILDDAYLLLLLITQGVHKWGSSKF